MHLLHKLINSISKIFFFLGIACILISGCTYTHVSRLDIKLDHIPYAPRIPLAVGIYYSPEFRNYELSHSGGPHQWVVPIGNASTKLFRQILPMVFDFVTLVEQRPPHSKPTPFSIAIIEPRIEDFDFTFPFVFFPFANYTAEITYRFILYSMDGTPYTSFAITGYGERTWGFDYLTHATPIGEATEYALQDVVKKLLTDFHNIPEVKRWLIHNGVLHFN